MTPMTRRPDPEMAFQFPTQTALKKRTRIAQLGALYILFALIGVPLIVLIIR